MTTDTAARPPIPAEHAPTVAAELRRLAAEDDRQAAEWTVRQQATTAGTPAAGHAGAMVMRYVMSAARLRERADELDGATHGAAR